MENQEQPERANRCGALVSAMRIVLWLLPSLLLAFKAEKIRQSAIHGIYLVLICIALLAIIGYIDQWLKHLKMENASQPEWEAVVFGTVMFVIIQFAIAPFIALTIFFGMCLTTGFPH